MLNMKAAVCDDEKTFHKEISSLVLKYMRVRNIEIYTDFYENGEELLRSQKQYDIIFLDYQMEGINGIETAEKQIRTALLFLLVLILRQHLTLMRLKLSVFL